MAYCLFVGDNLLNSLSNWLGRVKSLRWFLAAVVVISIVFVPSVESADPAFVGVLALAVDDEGARRLELTDEVREKLIALIDKREQEAVNLALQIRELPPAERERRLAPFVAESERMGMALLTVEQRSKLHQFRIQRAGMASLAEADIQKLLGLDEAQRQAIQRLLDERSEAMTEGGEQERRVTASTYERRLRTVLSAEQKANWDQLAGLGPGAQAVAADQGQADATAEAVADAADPEMATQQGSAPTEEPAATQDAVEPAEASKPSEPVNPEDIRLSFNFRFQPWEDVLDWLADSADLSLQSDLIPEGTFNYSDTRKYTPTEAIDLINGVLLTKGYTLVRRGRLLSVINLDDEVPDVLVEFVPVEKLDDRGEFELVKTVFHLAKMEPADAEEEIAQLVGPGRGMIVMPKARQILVIETAGKLRTIRDVIERAENPNFGSTKRVTEVALDHVTPEVVLSIARPLLGLEEGSNVGEGISIALGPLGTRMFVTGDAESIEILEDVVERVDLETTASMPGAGAIEQLQLQTHTINVADPEQAMAVLQTLLAGLPDVRLSLDLKTNKIIALARPSEHKTIIETIKQLEGEAPLFEVIQLRRIDPQLAVLTIANFFGGDEEGSDGPKLDADPTTMKLYVYATRDQIDQIKDLIDKLEGPAEGSSIGSNLRFLPMTGDGAKTAVETAERLWSGQNQIRFTTPSDTGPGLLDLREVNPGKGAAPATDPAARPAAEPARRDAAPVNRPDPNITRHQPSRVPARFASQSADEPPKGIPGSDIRVEITPGGILIASDDIEALDKFEELLRTVAGPQQMPNSKSYTVFFLKYAKAPVAQQLIQDILGGSSSGGAGGGGLLGDVASNLLGGGGGLLGALMGGGGGGDGAVTTIQATGPISMVSDPRLNCLVVQALPADLELVEELLKVVDREGSITDVQTAGKPRIIPVIYMQAEDVASVVRETYSNRIATQQSGHQQQPNPADLIRALRGGRGGGGNDDNRGEESKMTLAVDSRSNSLIVTAPEPLFEEVKLLVEMIDQAGLDSIEDVSIVTLKRANPEIVQKALESILGPSATTGSTSSSSSSSRPSGTSGAAAPFGGASPADIQRRMEFFQRMRSGGGFGGAPTGGRGGTSGRPGGTPTRGGGGSTRGRGRGR